MPRFQTMMTVFRKELRELSRDRRSLMVMFGVPVILYPLLFMGIGTLAKSKADQQKVQTARLVVENPGDAPELVRRLGLPDNHVELAPAPATDAQLARGDVDAVLVVPTEAEHRLLSGQPAVATTAPAEPDKEEPEDEPASATRPAGPVFKIRLDRSRSQSDAVASRLKSILAGYEHWVLQQRLEARGVPVDVLSPIRTTTVDIATQEQRLGRFLGQLLPMLLMITGMLGAFFPALNATTTERELGTLETLLVTPVNRTELLIAKGILVFLCSLLTAGLNMASMSLVFLNIASGAGEMMGRVAISPASIALAYAAVVPTLALFSAIVMCVGLVARTYREANSFAMPVMMLPMAAMAIGIADPPTTKALLATPIANTTILLRDILTGRVTAANFALACCANLLLAAAVISIAARLFTNEQLVNPAWEPISLKGFRRKRGGPRRFRLPTADEALFLIAATMLVQFYAGPQIGKLWTGGKINAPTFVLLLQVASFIVPTVLLARLAGYPVKQVFPIWPSSASREGRGFAIGSVEENPPLARLAAPRLPSLQLSLIAALLLGFGLAPIAMAFGQLQEYLTHAEPSDSAKTVAKLIGESLKVSPAVAVIFFGAIPGICEEIVFRGVVLTALRRTLNVHAAVWITAVLFAAIHMDMAGMLPRTVLGAVLGYVTVYSGSLLPAMLLHATFNGTQVGIAAYYDAIANPANDSDIPEGLRPTNAIYLARLAGGIIATIAGAAIMRASKRSADA